MSKNSVSGSPRTRHEKQVVAIEGGGGISIVRVPVGKGGKLSVGRVSVVSDFKKSARCCLHRVGLSKAPKY
jgi:hypothetical protein